MSRYENKYLISSAARNAIIPILRRRMRVDSHGTLGPGVYGIYSIYMDTDDLAAYHEKIDGLFKRCKVRLRHYSKDKGPYFLEMKERVCAQIIKNRALLSDEEFHCCVNGKPVPAERGNKAIKIYNDYVRTRDIKPKAIIGYTREAYESPLPGELRVTFDSRVTCQQCCWKGDNLRAEYRTLHPQWFILEIKFDMFMPRWIAELVADFSLWNEALCKYGWGINRLLKLGRIEEAAPLGYQSLLPSFFGQRAGAPAGTAIPSSNGHSSLNGPSSNGHAVPVPNLAVSHAAKPAVEKSESWKLKEAIDRLSQ